MTDTAPQALAEIAGKLTEAQRDIIRRAPIGGEWFSVSWEGWKGLIWHLQRKGLAFPREPGWQVLSPLGLALRSYLMSNSEGKE